MLGTERMVFLGGGDIEVILSANQLVSYLKVLMNSNNHVLKEFITSWS